MRIGIDVGGTNTDAVLMDGQQVLATYKSTTTKAVEDGIVAAVRSILAEKQVKPSAINLVSIGTTHFTNAFVQRSNLDRVGILRIAGPAAQALPPLSGWPDDIRSIIAGSVRVITGGYQVDGRVNAPLDESAAAAAARHFRKQGLNTIAVSGVFAPINPAMEERALELIRQEHPDCAITLSSRIGKLGLIERENAGIMNASLATLARETIRGFRQALDALGVTAPFFVSQNDGTLMAAEQVERYPVLTFASGPTNSMRGAAFLTGHRDALVADIGGTTTDIGMLRSGFPRESSVQVDVGGVRTNFRMPDVLALGLGGGSLVRQTSDGVVIGPKSVGYELTQKALVFGGDTLTTTDIAVAAGCADVGDAGRVKRLDPALVSAAVLEIHRMAEEGIDRMKLSQANTPLILVGGGSILIDDDLAGVSELLSPQHASVANAIGASIAQVGGETERVYAYEEMGREAAIEAAVEEAKADAVACGADAETLSVLEIDEVPLAYVPGGSVRVRAKVAGELLLSQEQAA